MSTDRRILRADRLIDGTGQPALEGVAVVLEGGQITGVGELHALELYPETPVYDFPGCTILPGFVDTHVHMTMSASSAPSEDLQRDSDVTMGLRAAEHARQLLRAGVTTVRDLGSRGRTMLDVRDAVADDIIPGPRILASGRPVTVPGGHLHMFGGAASGPEEVRALTRELIEEGVDVIKVIATGGNMTVGSDPLSPAFSLDEVRAVVEEARAAGIRVTSHARGVAGIAQVVEAGVDSIEHCRMEVGVGVWGFDEELARRIAAAGISAALTMSASHRAAQHRDRGGDVALRVGAIDTATRQKNGARLRECGVSVTVGTDAGAAYATFDEVTHQEMELLVGAGWSPIEAIQAGTSAAARAIGLQEIGSIEPGKQADLLVVAGDPSHSIGDVRRVVHVWKRGERVVEGGTIVRDVRRFRTG